MFHYFNSISLLNSFRYDCRGHLSDLTIWDSDLIRQKQSINDTNILTEEEKRIEEECQKERYLDLYKDMEKEALLKGKIDQYESIIRFL